MPDSQNWPQVILKPGGKPLESLAVASRRHPQPGRGRDTEDLITKFQGNASRLHWLCREALHGQPGSRRMVILVDQFEEVFSLCTDEDERKAFIDNLLAAATDAIGQAIVLLTMRALSATGGCGWRRPVPARPDERERIARGNRVSGPALRLLDRGLFLGRGSGG